MLQVIKPTSCSCYHFRATFRVVLFVSNSFYIGINVFIENPGTFPEWSVRETEAAPTSIPLPDSTMELVPLHLDMRLPVFNTKARCATVDG